MPLDQAQHDSILAALAQSVSVATRAVSYLQAKFKGSSEPAAAIWKDLGSASDEAQTAHDTLAANPPV